MIQLVVKQGVNFKYFTQPAIRIMQVALKTWIYLEATPTVTSAFDGKHMKDSLHYTGLAMDFRTKNLSEQDAKKWASDMSKELGKDYQCVIEVDHLHVEFDPKA